MRIAMLKMNAERHSERQKLISKCNAKDSNEYWTPKFYLHQLCNCFWIKSTNTCNRTK